MAKRPPTSKLQTDFFCRSTITLAFYNVISNNQPVARALRYLRGAKGAYTRADWMLILLDPNPLH